MKVEINKYSKWFLSHKIITLSILCLIISLFVFESFWVGLINKYWVNPVMEVLYNSESKSNLVLCIGIISSIIYYSLMFRYLKVYSISRVITFILFLYILTYFSDNWQYRTIMGPYEMPWIHLVFLYLIAEVILFIYCCQHRKKVFNSILEREDTHKTNDSYNRNNVVESTYETLKDCFYENGSFVVGIKGMWGSGKTTFIKQLENKFNNNKNKEFHIINFQPWRTDGANSITKLFFKELEDNLKIYIPSISNDIKKYLKYILPLNEDYVGKLLGNISEVVSYDTNPYDRIQTLLIKSKLPIIVFIDDVDRLSGEEILEVLKLVRNTADFPYMQFILCYDSDYVVKALKNNGIENASKYLEKFFNVEIDLPNYEDRIIVNELWNRLEHLFKTTWSQEKIEIEETLFAGEKTINTYKGEFESDYKLMSFPLYCPVKYKIYNVIRTLLPTVRDVIRFSNSFILISSFYKKIHKQNYISGHHLLMIELLRYRYQEIYNILKECPSELLEIKSDKYEIVSNYKQRLVEIKKYTTVELNSIEFLLSIFYSHSVEFGISKVRSFHNYFMYREDEKYLKEYEILELSSLSDEELRQRIEILYPQKYVKEFNEQFFQLLFKTIIYTEYEKDDIKNMISIDLYYLMERLIRLKRNDLSIDIINAFYLFSPYIKRTTINNIRSLVNFIISIPDDLINDKIYNQIISDLLYINYARKFVYDYDNVDIKLQCQNILCTLLNSGTHRCNKARIITEILKSRNKTLFEENNLIVNENKLLSILEDYFNECNFKVSEEGLILFSVAIEACKYVKDIEYSDDIKNRIRNIMLDEFALYPNDALSYFISTSENVLYINQVVMKIFDRNENIEKFIINNSDCDNYEYVHNFWSLYKNNNYQDVQFLNGVDVKQLINDGFEEQKKQVDYLIKLNENIDKYENLDEIKEIVRKMPFKIELRKQVLEKIEMKIKKTN